MSTIVEKVEQIAEAVNAAQDAATKRLDSQDVLLIETEKKAAEKATEIMQSIQDQDMRLKGLQEHYDYMEKQFSRVPADTSGMSDFELKARDALTAYLRRGELISDSIVESVCDDMAKKTLISVPEHQLEYYKKTLIAGNNPQGGYFIRPERSATMIQRVFETSPMRSIATITSTTSDSLEFIVDDNEASSGGWVGEVQPRPETSTPDIGKLTIPVHEQFAQPKATQKMLDDAGFDIEGWLSRKVTDIITRTENTAFVVGDGSQKPKGFLDYPAWDTNGVYQRYRVEQIPSEGTGGLIEGDDLKNIQNAVIENYQMDAMWGLKRATFEQIITLKDDQGRYIFNTTNLQTKDPMNLLGKPVIFMNDMVGPGTTTPGIFDAGELPIVYGDLTIGYTIVDRMGFRVIRDELTEKPFIKFYTTKGTGGAATNYQSYKLLTMSS